MTYEIRWSLTPSHVSWWPDGVNETTAPRQKAGDYSGNVNIDWPHDFVPRKGDHLEYFGYVVTVEEVLFLDTGDVFIWLGGDRRWRDQ